MISCPACSAKLQISRERQPVLHTTEESQHVFQILWVAKVDIHCPNCQALISAKYLQDTVPEEVVISEGAKAMSIRNKKRFNSQTGNQAANKRWNSEESDGPLKTGGKDYP